MNHLKLMVISFEEGGIYR